MQAGLFVCLHVWACPWCLHCCHKKSNPRSCCASAWVSTKMWSNFLLYTHIYICIHHIFFIHSYNEVLLSYSVSPLTPSPMATGRYTEESLQDWKTLSVFLEETEDSWFIPDYRYDLDLLTSMQNSWVHWIRDNTVEVRNRYFTSFSRGNFFFQWLKNIFDKINTKL